VGNPIWGFGWREAHRCGFAVAVSLVESRAPVRGQRGASRRGWRGQRGEDEAGGGA
jgi:hypothetical protein